MDKIKKISENVFMFIDEKINILEETEYGIIIPNRKVSITTETNDVDCNDEFLDVYEKVNYPVAISSMDYNMRNLSIECISEMSSYPAPCTSYNVDIKVENISISTGCTLMDRDYRSNELDKDRSLFVVSITESQGYHRKDWIYHIECRGIYNNSGKLYMVKYNDGFGTEYGITPSKDNIKNVYSSDSLEVKITNPAYTAKSDYEIL